MRRRGFLGALGVGAASVLPGAGDDNGDELCSAVREAVAATGHYSEAVNWYDAPEHMVFALQEELVKREAALTAISRIAHARRCTEKEAGAWFWERHSERVDEWRRANGHLVRRALREHHGLSAT